MKAKKKLTRKVVRKTASKISHYIYILECADRTLYVGYTTDLKRRLGEHNTSKLGARYTKSRRPVALRHSEKFKTRSDALKRECQIKKWKRGDKLKLLVI